MNQRSFLLLGTAALALAGSLGLACTSTTTADDTTGTDSGTDGTMNPDTGMMTDGGNKPDSNMPPPVCNTELIMGECNLVAQNCGAGKECIVAQGDGGANDLVTQCHNKGVGAIQKGDTCVMSASNPCVAGLQCISGRCTPACCFDPDAGAGDSTVCGNSTEGYPGACDLGISPPSGGDSLYYVCEYAKPCEPFGIQPCGMGQTCLVKDSVGTASCSDIFNPPGLAEKKTCKYANECGDGMMCLSPGVCTYTCFNKGGGSPPFDAGAVGTTPGMGGCPMGEKCGGGITGLPGWLGICQ